MRPQQGDLSQRFDALEPTWSGESEKKQRASFLFHASVEGGNGW
jgi:hypothetical protein